MITVKIEWSRVTQMVHYLNLEGKIEKGNADSGNQWQHAKVRRSFCSIKRKMQKSKGGVCRQSNNELKKKTSALQSKLNMNLMKAL